MDFGKAKIEYNTSSCQENIVLQLLAAQHQAYLFLT